jgi:hypothetical protein
VKNRISEPKLNRKKAKEVILYILSKLGPTSEKKLKALLYFIDYDFYEAKEKHLMGFKYIRPVECFKNKKHPTGKKIRNNLPK